MNDITFRDRRAAGRELARHLREYAGRNDVCVLALPRGGVPVAYEVARALSAPLDVLVVRKLGFPGQPELAMGALASGGVTVRNEDVLRLLTEPEAALDRAVARESLELQRRELAYRGDHPPLDVSDHVVILVDDGAATGATMLAAVEAMRISKAKQVVVALPVAAADTCQRLEEEADRVVCLGTPEPFVAVGCWYREFGQTEDDEVRELLAEAMNSA